MRRHLLGSGARLSVFFHAFFPRVERYFTLGYSLATLRRVPPGIQFVRALAQMIEEYEYHFSTAVSQGMVRWSFDGFERFQKLMRASAAATPVAVVGEGDTVRPKIQASGGTVVYEHLLTPHIVSISQSVH